MAGVVRMLILDAGWIEKKGHATGQKHFCSKECLDKALRVAGKKISQHTEKTLDMVLAGGSCGVESG